MTRCNCAMGSSVYEWVLYFRSASTSNNNFLEIPVMTTKFKFAILWSQRYYCFFYKRPISDHALSLTRIIKHAGARWRQTRFTNNILYSLNLKGYS